MDSANLRELRASEDEPSIPHDEVPWDRLYKMSEEEFDEFAKHKARKMVTIRITEPTRRKLRRFMGEGQTYDQAIQNIMELAEDFIAHLHQIHRGGKYVPFEEVIRKIEAKHQKKGPRR